MLESTIVIVVVYVSLVFCVIFRRFQILDVYVSEPFPSLAPKVYDYWRNQPMYLERAVVFRRELCIEIIYFFGELVVFPPYPLAYVWFPSSSS